MPLKSLTAFRHTLGSFYLSLTSLYSIKLNNEKFRKEYKRRLLHYNEINDWVDHFS
jgi:hypothetical protein